MLPVVGSDDLLTGKSTKVFRGRCVALPDVPACIVKPFAPQPCCAQLALESSGIHKCRKANRGGGLIVKAK